MKKIVVIAHDKYKSDMCVFLNDRAPWFYGRNIIATGRTAEYLEKHNCKIPVIHVQKGKAYIKSTCSVCPYKAIRIWVTPPLYTTVSV